MRSPTTQWTRRCSGCASARRVRAGRRARRRPTATRVVAGPRAARTPTARPTITTTSASSSASPANPPGFDDKLIGLKPATRRRSRSHFPADYAVEELADTDVTYTVTVKEIRRRVLPELDDEFAKDLGEFESLDALRERVRADLEHEARSTHADRIARRPAEAAGRSA